MKRLRVLLSAYSCEPGKGSEPGVGWILAHEMAKHHDVWVLTRDSNRRSIEQALGGKSLPNLRFAYYDFRPWIRYWKRGQVGTQLYYYLWQVGVYPLARRLHRDISFDLVHHVTFAKYWAPSFLVLLPVPFVWGPVGGGDAAPRTFWHNLSLRGKGYEIVRELARWVGEHDPFVRMTARRSALVLAKTEETAKRLWGLRARNICLFPGEGLPGVEINRLATYSLSRRGHIRFISIGTLLHLKGFDLGLCAFARVNLEGAEYWIVGEGPERKALEALARDLGIAGKVRFWGRLTREETLNKLGECDVLVHPSLHDSGGWVCAEAMAAGRPVICLDLGGPATQVTEGTGVKVRAHDPQQTVHDLAAAMQRLALDSALRALMGASGRQRSREVFCWERKGMLLDSMYSQVVRNLQWRRSGAVAN